MTETRRGAQAPSKEEGLSLLGRVLALNSGVLLAAAMVLIATPATISAPILLQEAVVVVAGLALLVITNLFLLRRAFAPLHQLAEVMSRVEPLHPGLRVPAYGGGPEIARLTGAFNDMLDRLETERRASLTRAIDAQESERLRVAQELHDEIGQSLTALKLLLSRALKAPAEEREAALADASKITDQTLTAVREIARRLRPETLEELGLANALAALAQRTGSFGDLRVERRLAADLPAIDRDTEVVIYRIAQESLTNVIRHAAATRAVVALERHDGELVLTVSDDGRGMRNGSTGHGIKGMHERALMIGGRLEVGASPDGGTRVRLAVPLAGGAAP